MSAIIKPIFPYYIKNIFEEILEKRNENLSEDLIIHHIFDVLSNRSLLDFNAAIWIPMQGIISNALSIGQNKNKTKVLYKLDEDYLIRCETMLLSSLKTIYAPYVAFDTFRCKMSNDIKQYMLDRQSLYGDKVTNEMILILGEYNLNKGLMAIHRCYNSYFNLVCLYRNNENNRDFVDEEMLFLEHIIPFFHIVFSIEEIPLIALIDEQKNESIHRSGSEKHNQQDLLSCFSDLLNKMKENKNSNIYSLRGFDTIANKYYIFFAVRIYDFLHQSSSGSNSVLAIAAFLEEDYKNKKYHNIYGGRFR